MAYSFAQLEGFWVKAGGPTALAPTMAAIALAESSGNPSAINPTDNNGKQTSWGLWQISDGTHNALPNWADPLANAQMAVAKYKASGFLPWGTYTSGAYLEHLPSNPPAPDLSAGGAGAVTGISAGGVGVGNSGTGATQTAQTADFLGLGSVVNNVEGYVVYVLIGIVGFALLAVGLILLVRETAAGQETTSTVRSVVGSARTVSKISKIWK